MIKLRIDVDYPYPSRAQSFLYTVLNSATERLRIKDQLLNLKLGKDYLKNSKIIARMINESAREVRAYWFFTPKTIPDRELLVLLGRDKHEVALHIANNPNAELKLLERATKRQINYYTIHGTARRLAQIIWRLKLGEDKVQVPNDFPLKSFHDFPTIGLDVLCYANPTAQVVKMVENSVAKGEVLEIHPEWLFNRGTINHRGPFYETLKRILEVDKELETLVIRKKGFARIARDVREYEKDIVPTSRFIEKLVDIGIDVFTFIERKWCCTIPKPSNAWVRTEDNIALLHVTTYDEWWKKIGDKTRNRARKAEKSGVKIDVVEPSEKLAEGIWRIYNETPIRQERSFLHYGISKDAVKRNVLFAENCTFIGAHLQDELIGFITLVHGDNITLISQMLSLQEHRDKLANNALIAKAIETCVKRRIRWVMCGRMGNHPSLDEFKEKNGFVKFDLPRYYIPITKKGQIATKLKLHREIKDVLPESIKYPLIPVYNWVSRNKMRIRLRLGT